MAFFQLALIVMFSQVSDSTIDDLTRAKNIHENEGFNYNCIIKQPTGPLSLLFANGSTAILCKSFSECIPNYSGYFHDAIASNETRVVFFIQRPEQGLYMCKDNNNNKTDRLDLLPRVTGCDHTTNMNNDTDLPTPAPVTSDKALSVFQHYMAIIGLFIQKMFNLVNSSNTTAVNNANLIPPPVSYIISCLIIFH